MQHDQKTIELKCCMFNISQWLQILDHVYNITHILHQFIEHDKLGLIIPLQWV
jgi:hypothetical protein